MEDLKKVGEDVQKQVVEMKNTAMALPAEKWWAMSCYVPIFNVVTCALTLVRMVNSKFCRFHGRQGLALFALWFLTIIVAFLSPIISLMLWGVVIVLHIAGAVIAFGGNETAIPVMGKLAMKIPEFYFFSLLTGKNPETEAERKDVSTGEKPAQ